MEKSRTTFENLRMTIHYDKGEYSMLLSVESSFVSFDVVIPLNEQDYAVIENEGERAAFLQAALHHPFQLNETRLGKSEQRIYLDKILHSSETETETFLTELDHGSANGAISNMVHLTCGKEQWLMRKGKWFDR